MRSDVERTRVQLVQMRLFPTRPREVCRAIKLNWMAALYLRDAGWLSFDPESISELNEGQEAELIFLGSLVVAGCDNAMLEQMLHDLKKPYQYSLERIFYDWRKNQWSVLPSMTSLEPEEFLREWLDELVEQENEKQLQQIEQLVAKALFFLRQNGEEEEQIFDIRSVRRSRLHNS